MVLITVLSGIGLFHLGQFRDQDVADSYHSDPNTRREGRVAAIEPSMGQPQKLEAAPTLSVLHQHLLTMSESHRNNTLLMILRDVGAECGEVISSQHLAAEISAWRADCGDALMYSVVFDAFGATKIYPIPYGDFGTGAPLTVPPIEPR